MLGTPHPAISVIAEFFGYNGTIGRPASERAPALKAATAQRGQLAAAQANLAELKAKRLSGELVEGAEVGRNGVTCS
jgi:phage terminase Nu1 subunit (DNA packaging protein)